MYSIPTFEISAPTGDHIHRFPLDAEGCIVINIPRNSPILDSKKVYGQFFRMNGIDNPPPLSRIKPCLLGGPVQLCCYNVVFMLGTPTKKPPKRLSK